MAQLDTRPDRVNRKQFKNTLARREPKDPEKGNSEDEEIMNDRFSTL
jgi:hypothetical protein